MDGSKPIFLIFVFVVSALTILGVAYPPYSAVALLGGLGWLVLLIARPELAFAVFFAVETLISEDILLVTEKLDTTLYRLSLPYIGINIFEAALLMLVLMTLLHRKGRLHGTPLDASVALFGVSCVLGYLTCVGLNGDWLRIFEPRRLLHFFVAYFLSVNLLRTRQALRFFLWMYFLAVVLKSLEGVYLYSAGAGLQIKWQIRAIFTGWEDSLSFVTFLLFLGVWVLDRCPFPWKPFFLAFSPTVFACFLFSYKRAYYVAMVVGIAALFWIQGRKARLRFIALLLIAVMLLPLILTLAGQWKAIGMRVDSILHPTEESSANYRLVEWQNALLSIRKHPVLGIGLGGIMPMEIYLDRTNLLGVHNTFLWVTVKMGIFGLFSYLLLHFAFIRQIHRQNLTLRNPFLRAVSRSLFCAFLAFSAAEMFAPMFAQMRTATWLGVILGIGITLSVLDAAESKNE